MNTKKTQKLIIQSLREGSISAWRNKFLSMTTILLGALILFLLNVVFATKFFADHSLKNLEQRADFSITLRDNFDSFEFEAMRNELKEFNLEINIYEKEKFEDFSLPPRLHVKFNNLREVGTVLEIFKKTRYDTVVGAWDLVGEKEFVNLIGKLLRLRDGVETASFWLIILFLGGGILLAFNAFQITIFSRKKEIHIARLVGADPSFIVGPFLVEGFLLGILSALAAISLFIFVLVKSELPMGGEIIIYIGNGIITPEIFIAGGVGTLGAYLALRKYLIGKFEN